VGRAVEAVAPGVHRLGSPLVNFYLVEEGGRYTLVDAGLPKQFGTLIAALEQAGADLHDVDALVLTHAHMDHVGIAERVRTQAQATVHVHAADAQLARADTYLRRRGDGTLLRYLRRPAAWQLFSHLARQGGARIPRIEDVTTFMESEPLDVPGRLTPIPPPGLSHGHCALLLADRGVLFAGDALCSRNPLTGRQGPQLMPSAFNVSTEQALASLDRLAPVDAGTVLFGHGEPWTGTPAGAVQRAQELGPS
jgi:glyoxylase-like metal-dependent hydrolase (beta-lactamase superfamily II)